MKRGKPLRKKRLLNTTTARAMAACERAWKEAIYRRASGICEVHGTACQDPVKQADHFVEGCKSKMAVFFDEANGTLVCRTLNFEKSKKLNMAAYRIAKVVEAREGMAKVADLLTRAKTIKKWSIPELEQQTEHLNGLFKKEKTI